MICPTCRGRGFGPRMAAMDDDGPLHGPCEDCGGSGIASCCDAAGSAEAPSFVCPRCRAVSYNPNDIRERYCGACHQWADR